MKGRRSKRGSAGAVYFEFLLAFPPLWLFCLCVFQLIQLARADLIVRHAADSAARSASVVLSDDPGRYGNEPERSVSREWTAPTLEAELPASRKSVSEGHDPLSRVLGALLRGTSSRRGTIATAARVPLLSLTSEPIEAGTLSSSLGAASFAGALSRAFPDFTLEFPDAIDDRVEGPEVTVLVRFNYRCAVPLARHLMCGRDRRSGDSVWRFEHSSTLLIHDAPYQYRSAVQG